MRGIAGERNVGVGDPSMTAQAPSRIVFHMCRAEEWAASEADQLYPGSTQDREDGFIHFSTAEQVVTSAAKHRAGQDGLVLIAADAQALGPTLRWEPSRGGQLFPHLHGPLPWHAVLGVHPLPLGADGAHVFPNLDGPPLNWPKRPDLTP